MSRCFGSESCSMSRCFGTGSFIINMCFWRGSCSMGMCFESGSNTFYYQNNIISSILLKKICNES